MKYTYGNVVLPCNNLEDLNTNDPSMDIVCRIYLKEAPDDTHEKIAKREDGATIIQPVSLLSALLVKMNQKNRL